MIKTIKVLLDNVYKYHSKIVEENIYKEYTEENITLYVSQKGQNVGLMVLNNSTDRNIYLGANRYISLFKGFLELGEIKKDYIKKSITIILNKEDIEIHKLINENNDRKLKELEHEVIELKQKLKLAENIISSLRSAALLSKKKNIRGAGRKEKFTPEEKEKIIKRRINGITLKELSLEFNCSIGMIHKVLNSK